MSQSIMLSKLKREERVMTSRQVKKDETLVFGILFLITLALGVLMLYAIAKVYIFSTFNETDNIEKTQAFKAKDSGEFIYLNKGK